MIPEENQRPYDGMGPLPPEFLEEMDRLEEKTDEEVFAEMEREMEQAEREAAEEEGIDVDRGG